MASSKSVFLEKLKSDEKISDEDIRSFLMEFHSRHAGITERTYGRCRTERGQTSYEILANLVHRTKDRTILDLACGNGPLTRAILKSVAKVGNVIGVDLSSAELQLAKESTKNSHVSFRCESAQEMSIESESVDFVLCHMALMLFRPLDPVVAEISRVLKPGGTFAAIVPLGEPDPIFVKAMQMMTAILFEEYPRLKGFVWGDVRSRQLPDLQKIFSTENGFDSDLRVTPSLIGWSDTPQKLGSELMDFFYYGDFFDANAQERLRLEWIRYFEPLADKIGRVMIRFPLSLIVASKLV